MTIKLSTRKLQLNRLDGRTIFIAWVTLSLLLFFLKNSNQYLAMLLFFMTILTVFFTKYERFHILKSWRLFIFLPLINLMANSFFINGTVLLSLGIFSLTDTDIKIVFRLLFLLVMSKAILLKADEKKLGVAIGSFLYSLSFHRIKHSTVPLVFMIIMAFLINFKMVIIHINSSYLIRTSHLSKQTRLAKIRNRLKLLLPILVISLKKTNTVATALLAKGYHKGSQFIDYRTIQYKKADYFSLVILGCFVVFVLNI